MSKQMTEQEKYEKITKLLEIYDSPDASQAVKDEIAKVIKELTA